MTGAAPRRALPLAAVVGALLVAAAIMMLIAAVASGLPVENVPTVVVTAVVTTPSMVLGVLLLIQRPNLWVGAQLAALGSVPLITAVWTFPAWLAGTLWQVVPNAISWPFWLISPLLLAFTFPDGRALLPRWRPVLWAVPLTAAASIAAILLAPSEWEYSGLEPPPLPPESVTSALSTACLAALLCLFALAVVSVFLRYRHGDGIVRLQVRWLALVFLILPIGMVAALASVALVGEAALIGSVFLGAAALALPVAVWVAVSRHGLYEIGRVVSRTVSYAIVTALVIGVYVTVVTSVTWLLPGVQTVGVALATLVAAAVALPVLRIIQRRIDRQFDREHYVAQRVVDDFGESLRTGTDPLTAAEDLTSAVERTLQPVAIGVWTTGPRS
ncbi:membrane hypothetical protein [Microbacterium sp. C448]|jgi:hypothetical protein|uniref:hypothetical protein n=1 Tax=Microbacterium TaxID=33882 RepID=UPI0003DE3A16|nr:MULTISPECIES: hypothetical protein [Microbacterium]CDK00173.1 membrane hypothetical protein [Microbacterium sp. C448]